jgi:uncharacterized protein YndB with AHSA1/START domain
MSEPTPTDPAPGGRSIELEVEVDGTPEEVWEAIATGPGISSWYVPTTVEEREGGATTTAFGEAPEMQIPGVVAAWEPPRRIVFTGPDGPAPGLAFEWLVEARDGGTCIVRLVNSGFLEGDEWDDQYDGMTEGWQLFLHNLQLHRRHFAGRHARSILPTATWPGPRASAAATLSDALGIPGALHAGDRLEVDPSVSGSPPLSGTVVQAEPWRTSLVLDGPVPGTAFLAAEGDGDEVAVSVWVYGYGEGADAWAATDGPAWQAWLDSHGRR